MKLLFTLVFIQLLIFSSFSQTKKLSYGEKLIQEADSVLKDNPGKAIRFATKAMDDFGGDDKIFVDAASIISEAYRGKSEFDSAEVFTRKGLQKALKIQDTINIIFFYLNSGFDYYFKADYSNALSDFKNSTIFYEGYGFDRDNEKISPLHYAKLLNNIASTYIKTGRHDSSLVYFIKSMKIREDNNAPLKMITVGNLNIGSIYLVIDDYKNSKTWLDKALQSALLQNDSVNIQKCYANLGILYKKTGDTIKSIEYSKKSLEISKGLGDHRNQAIVLQNLALLLINQKKYDEAHKYFKKALAENNSIGANNSRLHLGLSELFLEQHIYDSTIYHGKLAIKLASESGDMHVQIENFMYLYQAYQGLGKYSEANKNIEKYLHLKDSITTKENQEFVQKLKTEFETERKESEIEFLKKINESESIKAKAVQSRQNLIIIVMVLAIALLVLLAISYYFKQKKEKELHLSEKNLLEADIQNRKLARKELELEITFKTKQLTTHALNMMQKNQILKDILEKLKITSKKVDDNIKSEFKSMIRDINQSQKTEKDWELFKSYFENVNKDFNKKLRDINPNLSTHDYRLAALISLNLNIKETSALLNISPNSVKTARYRLRSRLNVGSGEDLYVFFSKL
ncbi:MAG: hypothetical protein DRJ05_12880 [Bacteroidetes bacterium]|nr:MAG: hypothetical protein DRJ05_12880 [Bacteroidota bacterium]